MRFPHPPASSDVKLYYNRVTLSERPRKGNGPMPKLLLVDDQRDLLDALKTLFTLEGYRVEAARSGHEAMAKLPESRAG